MLTNEQIKQKWTECVRSHRRGDVISSVDMAIDLARWVEAECTAERDRLAAQVSAMRSVLANVEYIEKSQGRHHWRECAWCGWGEVIGRHGPDCPRQAALASTEAKDE